MSKQVYFCPFYGFNPPCEKCMWHVDYPNSLGCAVSAIAMTLAAKENWTACAPDIKETNND